MIGYKKAYYRTGHKNKDGFDRLQGVVVKLDIPNTATIVSVRTYGSGARKFRTSRAYVEGLLSLSGKPIKRNMAFSSWDNNFLYTVGCTVNPKEKLCLDETQVCASGIHFFLTFEEARDWL